MIQAIIAVGVAQAIIFYVMITLMNVSEQQQLSLSKLEGKHAIFAKIAEGAFDNVKKDIDLLNNNIGELENQTDGLFYFYMIQKVLDQAGIIYQTDVDPGDLSYSYIYIGDKLIEPSLEALEDLITKYGIDRLMMD